MRERVPYLRPWNYFEDRYGNKLLIYLPSKTMSLKLTESAKVSESSFDYLLGELLSSKDPLSLVMPRLERIGYDVGYRLVESIVEKHKFNSREPVDLVKFICKEFWEELFGKKMDKLQANNKGNLLD